MPFVNSLCFLFLLCSSVLSAQQPQNPLLVRSNQPILFPTVTARVVTAAVSDLLKTSRKKIDRIVSIPATARTVENTLLEMARLENDLSDLGMKLALVEGTYTDDSTRDRATTENNRLDLFSANLSLNEELYKAIKQFAETEPALLPSQKKYLRETIANFEKKGMQLTADKRKELEAINEKIIVFGSLFDNNISDDKDSLVFTAGELQGVPEENLAEWKQSDGSFLLYLTGPTADIIAEFADIPETRKKMFAKYSNRAFPENIAVLDSLLYYRQLMAGKLGFKSYAEYALTDKMAAKPAVVWAFEEDLLKKLNPKVTEELKEMNDFKRKTDPLYTDSLQIWDLYYYKKKYLDSRYKLNTSEVKEYFEINNTISGMFSIYETLLNIRIRETKGIPVWYRKVKSFEIEVDGKKAGSFYLDLYPRDNKYTHFACFPISSYNIFRGKELLPVAALVCNFPEGNASAPSLLQHGDVVTLFHEFGHLVHMMVGRTDISVQGPFFTKGDFVEAPSQLLENWCWEYAALKTFARHYKTGKQLPETLFNKMKAAQNVNVAIRYMIQVYFGMLDFSFEDRYNEIKKQGLTETAEKLFSITQLPGTEGISRVSSFEHLNGYAANYYGYLWSKVFAQDMFSVFEKNGVMDTGTGVRYRKLVLEKGASEEESELLRKFLGREPDSAAFLKALGLE